MHIDEFVSVVAGESERIVTRSVRRASAQTLAAASRPGGMSLKDLMSAPAKREQKTFRFGHVLGAAASPQAVEAWCRHWPSHPLPADLVALVRRMNGIHLWANLETGRSYMGLAPIEEWDLARNKMYGASAERGLLDDRYVALTYHEDGASFLVLDVVLGAYYLMDVSGPDDSTRIANNVGDLLEWLWKHRVPPTGG
jgi:hypothetical protein